MSLPIATTIKEIQLASTIPAAVYEVNSLISGQSDLMHYPI